jgi:hypothetical protein
MQREAFDAAIPIHSRCPMIRFFVIYGIIAGLIVVIPMDWRMLAMKPDDMHDGLLIGYLTMIVGMTAVFFGIKHYRDKVLGGVIKFGRALVVGLGISVVASLIYAIGWEISLRFMSYDFATYYAKSMVDHAVAAGATPEQLAKATADAASFTKMYSNPLLRFPMTFIELFPVGILVSLVSAALLRNSRLLPATSFSVPTKQAE